MSRGLLLFLLPICLPAALPSPAEVEQLIQTFGPVMKLHPSERYLMDDPAYVLNSGKTALEWGLVHHESDYDQFSLEGVRGTPVASEAALPGAVAQARQDPRASQADFQCWLRIDKSLLAGRQSRAKAFVSVWLAPDGARLDLQFWFFYPFNGPGKFRVTYGKLYRDHVTLDTCGRHYGDWEHVTLRLARVPGGGSLPWRLQDVYLSRHSISKWADGLASLRFSGLHPVIYIARDSHAHYASPGIHYYRRVWSKDFWFYSTAVDLEDWTADGPEFDAFAPGHYQIISSNIPGRDITAPAWYGLGISWGQFEKLSYSYRHIYTYKEIGGGPGGPARHGADWGD